MNSFRTVSATVSLVQHHDLQAPSKVIQYPVVHWRASHARVIDTTPGLCYIISVQEVFHEDVDSFGFLKDLHGDF